MNYPRLHPYRKRPGSVRESAELLKKAPEQNASVNP